MKMTGYRTHVAVVALSMLWRPTSGRPQSDRHRNLSEGEESRKFPDARCSLGTGSVTLPLESGENEIAVALANNFFEWRLVLRLVDPDGIQLAAK